MAFGKPDIPWWTRQTAALRSGGYGSLLEQDAASEQRVGKAEVADDDGSRGGKPEHPINPPAPTASTGTKYPDFTTVSGILGSVPGLLGDVATGIGRATGQVGGESPATRAASTEADTKTRADLARINAAMPKAEPKAMSGIGIPGFLNYSIGGGPMHSRAPGQGRQPGEDFSAGLGVNALGQHTGRGHGFGTSWEPSKGGGGGYMQSDINSLPWEQKPESYRESHMSPLEEQESPIGAIREKSRLERDAEAGRRSGYQAEVMQHQATAAQAIKSPRVQSLPLDEKAKEILRIQNELERDIETIKGSYDVGARFRSNPYIGG